MGIVNCTTAAQYFHVLRRQMRRSFRKPLVVVAPKKMLKFGPAGSNIEDFATDTTFMRVIGEQSTDMIAEDKVRKVVFCSGQVYYDLSAERNKRNLKDVTIVRVEQLSPWPFRSITAELERYKNAEIVWCQEENKNGGVWSFAEPRFRSLLKSMGRSNVDITYAGRDINCSPSTGFGSVHKQQLIDLVDSALLWASYDGNGDWIII